MSRQPKVQEGARHGRQVSRAALLADYAAIAERRGEAPLAATALRAGSRSTLDVLSYLASRGQFELRGIQQLLAEARASTDRPPFLSWEPWNGPWLASLARVLALQNHQVNDRVDALAMYDYLANTRGVASFAQLAAETYAQLLFGAGRSAELHDVLEQLELRPAVDQALRTDLVNPFASSPGSVDKAEWIERFSRVMGFECPAFELEPAAVLPFDRLCAHPSIGRVAGPLVTVIMPVYRPDEGLFTAVRSIVQQTWTNVEVLLIEDGSPLEFAAAAREAESLDDRVRLIRKPHNGGTYRARNTGLALACGEFVTFQDADDWSHPERLERQVAALLGNEKLVASWSLAVRADDRLAMTQVGYTSRVPNSSSLLFRREPVLARLGFFDNVRKAADTEYRMRIEARFGKAAVRVLSDRGLAIIRQTTGSLSRSDFQPGWNHPSRTSYRGAYELWHDEIRAGADSFLAKDATTRRFPAPKAFRYRRDLLLRSQYDVVFVGDWRAYGGPQRSMIEEIRVLIARGLAVGISHMEALRFLTHRREPLCRAVRQLLSEGVIASIEPDEPADIDLLILRYPPILQFTQDVSRPWNVGKMWIVGNQAPSERDGRDLRYIPADCTSSARTLFGVKPLWVPQGPAVRRALEPFVPSDSIANFDNVGFLDGAEWYREHRPWEHPSPRVGRYSRDNPMKFSANRDSLMDVYGHDDVSVVMLGGAKTVPYLLDGAPVPTNWKLLRQDAVDVKSLLAEIDFFVYYDHPDSYEAFGRSVLEAIASGCAVVLPHHFADVFGEAALYASERDAMDVVRALHDDPVAFREQAEKARSIVADRFSGDAFFRLIESELRHNHTVVSKKAEAWQPKSPSPGIDVAAGHEDGEDDRSQAPIGQENDVGAADGDMPGGFVVADEWLTFSAPKGWDSLHLGPVRYVWEPRINLVRRRIESGDRLRDPYDIVAVGDPVDLHRPSNSPAAILEDASEIYPMDGLEALGRFVGRLTGRFCFLLHDGDELVAFTDASDRPTIHLSMSRTAFVLGTPLHVVSAVVGVRPQQPTQKSNNVPISSTADRKRPCSGTNGIVQGVPPNSRVRVNTLGRRVARDADR